MECLSINAAQDSVSLRFTQEALEEGGTINIGILSVGRRAYRFFAPSDWRIEQESAGGAVKATAADGSIMRIRFPENKRSGSEARIPGELLRERVLRQFTNGRVVQEFACFSEGGEGRGCDVEWTAESGTGIKTRLAVLDVKGAEVEFSLTTSPDKFERHVAGFVVLLNSFQPAQESQPAVRR